MAMKGHLSTVISRSSRYFIYALLSKPNTLRPLSGSKMFFLLQDSDSYQAMEDNDELIFNIWFIVLGVAVTVTVVSLTYYLLVRFAVSNPDEPEKTSWTLMLFKNLGIPKKASETAKSSSSVDSCSSASDSCSTATGRSISKPEPLSKPSASPSSAASSGPKLLWGVPGEKRAQKAVQKMPTKGQLLSNLSKVAASKNEKVERILNKDKHQFKDAKLNPKEFSYFQPEISPKMGGQSPAKESKGQSMEGSESFASVFSPGEPSLTNSSVKTAPILGVPIADDKSSNLSSDSFMLRLKSH